MGIESRNQDEIILILVIPTVVRLQFKRINSFYHNILISPIVQLKDTLKIDILCVEIGEAIRDFNGINYACQGKKALILETIITAHQT